MYRHPVRTDRSVPSDLVLALTYVAVLVDGRVLLPVRQLASSLELMAKALELFHHTDQCHPRPLRQHGNVFATYLPPVPY
jgi:hypothetical protein